MIYYANIHSGANMTIQAMLLYLFEFGMSQTEIALTCGSTQPTISRVAKGATVRYEVGKAIEALYLSKASSTLNANLRPNPAAHQSTESAGILSSAGGA
jgi:predicted XRE-type DNA-binding protein